MYSPIANQLVQYIEELNEYSSIECVGVVLADEMNNHQAWFEDNYPDVPFLCCSKEESEQLSILDAIIIPESNRSIYEYIPSSITKIGLPHGTDIPIEATLCLYGGGFYFDYILSARKQPDVKLEKYSNNFPAPMRLHKLPFVCQLPFGFPKLDKFFNVVTKNKKIKKSIIYHISLLSIEEGWVAEYLFETLKTLLNEFPDHKIVFRVHHFNIDDPKVVRCIDMGNSYPNFYYSDADSYIDDYADGAVMVTHREYYNHLFDLATGCPTVLYKKNDYYIMQYEHNERYFSANKSNFVAVLNLTLNVDFDTSIEARKQRCLDAGIYNPGGSLDYFVSNLKHIVNGETLPEWTVNHLNKGSLEEINFKLRQIIVSNRPFGPFAMANAVMMNYSALSLLLLAESFLRQPGLKSYYYLFGLQYFYQLIHHDDFNTVLMEAEYWWTTKGMPALEFCFEAMRNGEISPMSDLSWLREHYQVSTKSTDKMKVEAIDEFKFINLYNDSYIKDNEIVLYGAGEFCERIIMWNKRVKIFKPIAIIDGDKSKQNTVFCDIPVIPPSQLNEYFQDIVICSQGSFFDIINFLKGNSFQNRLFGFVDEPINVLLLNLVIQSNEA